MTGGIYHCNGRYGCSALNSRLLLLAPPLRPIVLPPEAPLALHVPLHIGIEDRRRFFNTGECGIG